MNKRNVEELKEKIRVHEQVLHDIRTYLEIMPDPLTINNLHAIICAWSKAHGTQTEESKALIQHQFNRLKKAEYLNE